MRPTVTTNLLDFSRQLERQARQVEFAFLLAATRTATTISRESPAYLERKLDRPSPYTKRGLYVVKATRQQPFAVVGFKDIQAAYLLYQEEGGQRAPRRRAIVLPSKVTLDPFGNLPPAQLRRLYDRAKNDKRATKALGKRLGISSKVDLFIGDPGEGFPPGIFKRTRTGLIPIVVFREQPVTYKPRLAWREWATQRAREVLMSETRRAVTETLATAR